MHQKCTVDNFSTFRLAFNINQQNVLIFRVSLLCTTKAKRKRLTTNVKSTSGTKCPLCPLTKQRILTALNAQVSPQHAQQTETVCTRLFCSYFSLLTRCYIHSYSLFETLHSETNSIHTLFIHLTSVHTTTRNQQLTETNSKL